LADRKEISLGLRDGAPFTAIALRLGRAVSTVSREVAGNGGRNDYHAWRAHQQVGGLKGSSQHCLFFALGEESEVVRHGEDGVVAGASPLLPPCSSRPPGR
jgi:hypothetical protein